MTLALVEIDRPARLPWPAQGLPAVAYLGGARFLRSVGLPRRSGIVAHYRQDVGRLSAHAYVFADGTYSVEHIDEYNPRSGIVAHFLRDVL